MAVQLLNHGFDPAQETARFEAELAVGSYGATASFVGTMRNHNEGDSVAAMTLEHYPGMTEKQLEEVVLDARSQWDIVDALIVHRVGDVLPGQAIVLTVVCSAHRAAAFEACRFLMEALKSRATFWKKETLTNGEQRWVEKNTPGTTT